jgi:hypothetical protein
VTGLLDRIKAAHRGRQMAAPASQSRLLALGTFGLSFEQIDEFNVIVEGEYHLNLAMSFWRASDGKTHGYLISALHAAIKRNRNPEKPAEGRDSTIPREVTAGKASGRMVAESSAGAVPHYDLLRASPWQ